jgi:DNA-binding CsgD family transcriptional regulator
MGSVSPSAASPLGTIHAIARWAQTNQAQSVATYSIPTHSFPTRSSPTSCVRVDTIPIDSFLVSSVPLSTTPVSFQTNADQGQQDVGKDVWARRQGATDFAASLLSIASSYTPEVFRCLSELIYAALDQPGLLAQAQTSEAQNLATQQAPHLLPEPAPKTPFELPPNTPLQASSKTASKRHGQPLGSESRLQLSPSEQRVAELVSKGLSLRKVGAQLYISAKTADFHLQSVYRKLDVHNRGEFANAFFHLQNAA